MGQEANAGMTEEMQPGIPESYGGGFPTFLYKTLPHFLTARQGVYSPLNAYITLALLAELTAGESRGQILSLLEAEDVEVLRTEAAALWRANVWEGRDGTSLLANSLWLRQGICCNPAVLSNIKSFYHTACYQGVMGSLEFCQAQQQWLDANTRHQLSEQAEHIFMGSDTILGLASAISFQACWMDSLEKEKNTREVFHGAEGDIICEFMHESARNNYYWGERFLAVRRFFEEGSTMWLVLPEDGHSPEELLRHGQVISLVLEEESWENQGEAWVTLSLPKFCVSSEFDFCKGWRELGITDIFEEDRSDFGPLVNTDYITVSQALHAASVTIDEQGCEAAAFTAVSMEMGSALLEELEEIDISLDRPFLFFITSPFGQILFAGIVAKPL